MSERERENEIVSERDMGMMISGGGGEREKDDNLREKGGEFKKESDEEKNFSDFFNS